MESAAWKKESRANKASRAVTSSCLILFVVLHAVFLNAGCTAGFGTADISAIVPTPTPTGTVIDDGIWGTSLTESPLLSWQALTSAKGIDRYEVAVGTTAGGTDILTWTDNGRSLSRKLSGLSLVEGSRYYASVRLVDSKGNAGTVFKGDGWIVDSTAPLGPSNLDDATYTTSLTDSAVITWSASTETGSGLAKYELGIGTTPGAVDVVGWTDVGVPSVRSHTFTGLTLLEGKTYYASLRATDIAGNVSAIRNGNGWTVNNTLSVVSNSFATPLDTVLAVHDGGGVGASQMRLVGGQFTVARTSANKLNGIGRVVGADGALDSTFTPGIGFNDDVNVTRALSDAAHVGKILVGGKFNRFNLTAVNRVVRLNVDGTLDTGFIATATATWDEITAMVVQSDGKVIVAGQLSGATRVLRLNTDGSQDINFNVQGTGLNGRVRAMALLSTGEIVVGGDFTSYNGTPRSYIARLTAAGALDGAFTVTGLNGAVHALSISSGNSVLIAGDFTNIGGTQAERVAKLTSVGANDTSFNAAGTGFDAVVRAMAVLSSGKILLGGDFTTYKGTTRARLALLETNGSLSTDLVPAGSGFDDAVHALLVQPDGAVVVGGEFADYDGTTQEGITRLTSTGARDASFDAVGSKLVARRATNTNPVIVRTLARRSDASIVFGGTFASYDSAFHSLVRLDSTGAVDSTFNTGGVGFASATPGLAPSVRAIHRLASGKILVGGQFSSYNGTNRSGLVYLNNDGTLDSTTGGAPGFGGAGFAKGGDPAAAVIYGIAIQSTGSIVVVGDFDSYNGDATYANVIRLDATGIMDATFNGGFSLAPDALVRAVVIGGADVIYIGGDFSDFAGGVDPIRVARLTSAGAVDGTFATGTGFDTSVEALALQGDGKLIAVGSFASYNTVSASRIARLNTNGTLDTFNIGTGLSDDAYAVYVQSDGKIVVAGKFTQFNGTTRGRIARLESTGAIDSTVFGAAASTTESTGRIRALYPFGNALAIGGSFAVFNGGAGSGNPIPSPGYAEVKDVLP